MTTIVGTVKGLRDMYYDRKLQKKMRAYVQMRDLLAAHKISA
jgi:hypothetical protein